MVGSYYISEPTLLRVGGILYFIILIILFLRSLFTDNIFFTASNPDNVFPNQTYYIHFV